MRAYNQIFAAILHCRKNEILSLSVLSDLQSRLVHFHRAVLTLNGCVDMYTFAAYKLMVDLLTVHGIDIPVSPDRSTLHRWRVSDRVPCDTFRLVYYCAVHFLISV